MSRGSKALFAHRLLLGPALEARREMEGRDFISLTSTEPVSNNTILHREREKRISESYWPAYDSLSRSKQKPHQPAS